jgi:hypothetical protein
MPVFPGKSTFGYYTNPGMFIVKKVQKQKKFSHFGNSGETYYGSDR